MSKVQKMGWVRALVVMTDAAFEKLLRSRLMTIYRTRAQFDIKERYLWCKGCGASVMAPVKDGYCSKCKSASQVALHESKALLRAKIRLLRGDCLKLWKGYTDMVATATHWYQWAQQAADFLRILEEVAAEHEDVKAVVDAFLATSPRPIRALLEEVE